MNVQEFVADTLVQIASAISDANARLKEASVDATANPPAANLVSQGSVTYQGVSDTQRIEFDIAVTVEKSATIKGEAGFLMVLKLGTEGNSATTNAQVSRIRFSIPLKLPMHK